MFYDSIAHTMALFDGDDDADDGVMACGGDMDRRTATKMTILRPIRFFCLSDEVFREGSDRQSNNAINQSRGEQ